MATRISPPQNKTYYINPAYLSFVENSGYGANLIQVSASSSCYISVYDPANGIGYSDADRNYRRWKVTAHNNKFPDNAFHYIYVRLERSGTSSLVVYDKKLVGVKGGLLVETTDKDGNKVMVEEGENPSYYFIRIGEVTETDGASIREITYDTGYLTSDEALNDKTGESEMWKLDKYSFINPLIQAIYWLKDFTVKGFITLLGGIVFKNSKGEEKPVVDLKRSFDSDIDVPVSDDTIPTTEWVKGMTDDRYLKRYEPDETQYRIKFFDGIEAGHFVKGMIGGSGTLFDGLGYGEMNGLTLREFLEVPELRFNRIDVVSGELWNSIAFGLVESVDTDRRICHIKLEGRERCGIHLYDICRGIFADFGDGTQWEGVDECGFLHLYGFWTSYFTPVEILENGEGVFSFRYELKPGTSQHPVPSMKFAVYGNFVDASRQASAYSTRTYKRYLNKVDTWVIDPDKHIYAQFGELDGLTIGGKVMEGYGSFQHNCYFTGTMIQFTPQQKLELQGESAYTAVLSDYEGIVTIDDEGNIIGGETEMMNVVSDGGNVITDGMNVVTAGYKLQTSVQAMRGSTQLFYSPSSPGEGAYTIAIQSVGCTAVLINGVVVVTSVFHTERCLVNITVNCEGKASFQLVYRITAVRDGKNPIIADIDNEMDSVACDSSGKVLFGLPVSCTVSMWAGSAQLPLDSLSVSAPQGVTYTADHSTGVVAVTAITDKAERTLPLNIRAYASYGGTQYHKDLVFTVNKVNAGENALLYKLSPSASSVKVDDAGNMTATAVSCKVVASDGNTITVLGSLGEAKGLSMKYYLDDNAASSYTYGSDVSISDGNKTVTFQLYSNNALIDVETIPIIVDGSSPFIVDLDNEMQSVACDESGAVLLGLPLSTGVKAFFGSKELSVKTLTVGSVSGVTASKSGNTVTVTAITASAPENIRIPITVTATHDKDYTRTVYLVVNKLKQGNSAVVLDLVPSVSAVKVDADGTYTPSSISCTVKRTTGKKGADTPASLPYDYSMTYAVDGVDKGAYTYGSSVTLTDKSSSVETSVTFCLYYKGTLVDRETVPVVKDGASPVVLDLDNEMQSVACDEAGTVVSGLPLSTGVKMYYGATEMTISSLSVSAPTGVTASKSGTTVSVTAITKAAANTLNVAVTATGSFGGNTYTKTATLVVNKVRQGNSAVVLDLVPSVSAVKVNSSNTYSPTSVSCAVKQTNGKNGATTPSSLPSGYTMKYKLDSGSETSYTYNSAITVTSASTGITFYLYYGNTLVDRETVPVVKDGASPVVLDLDNEMQSVACDEAGTVVSGLPLSTGVKMYYGATEMTISSLSVSAPTGVTASKSGTTVSVTAITKAAANTLNVAVTATGSFGGNTYTKTATLVVNKVRQGNSAVVLDLVPSVSAVKVNSSNTYSPTSVSCAVKQTNGKNGATTPSSLPSGYTMKYKLDSGSETSYTYNSAVTVTSASTGITFYLYYGNTLVDRETVPVVKDGKNGANGTNGTNGTNGKDGADGTDGADAEFYTVEAAVATIGYTMTGSYSPSSFIVGEYHVKGASKSSSNKYWMFIYGVDTTGEHYLTYTGNVQDYTFNAGSYISYDYDSFLFELREYNSSSSALIASTSVSVARRGEPGAPGSDGDPGPMPRYCGFHKYSPNISYVYDSSYRDIVVYNGDVYQVLSRGATVPGTILPTDTSYWEKASKFSFVAMDTALIDGANIAGFMFNDSKMVSQYGHLVLDGINGKLECDDVVLTGTINADAGYIGNWSISDGEIYQKVGYGLVGALDNFECRMNAQGVTVDYSNGAITSSFGQNYQAFSDWAAYASFSAVNNIASSSYVAYRKMLGVYVKGISSDLGVLVDGPGINIMPDDGAMSIVGGLGLRYDSMVSGTAPSNVDILTITGGRSVSLPNASIVPGKIYITKIVSGTLTARNVYLSNESSPTRSQSWTNAGSRILVSNGSAWIEVYGA